jgi:hypothetical protein
LSNPLLNPLKGPTVADLRTMEPGSLFWISRQRKDGSDLALRIKDLPGQDDDPAIPAYVVLASDGGAIVHTYQSDRPEFCFVMGHAVWRASVAPDHVVAGTGRDPGKLWQASGATYLSAKSRNDGIFINLRTFEIAEHVVPRFEFLSWSLGIEVAGCFTALHHGVEPNA